jgi:hypothetical protein
MSLESAPPRKEQTRSAARKAPRRKERRLLSNWSALDSPLAAKHPNQVLLFAEWCQLNRFSERTGRRLIAAGDGPQLTQLSNHRFGITVANNAAWQKARERREPEPHRYRGPSQKPKERT